MANEVDYNPCQYKGNGVTRDFSFNWKVIEVEELIVSLELVSTGDETILTRGSDYTAQVNAVGGNVLLTTAPSEDYFINIRRKTSNYQSKGYSTSSGFQGSEIEKSFDKVSCCLQDMQHGIDTFKEEYTAETNQKIDNFETETNNKINTNKSDTDTQIQDFKDEVNGKIIQVTEAVNQLNRLDEVLENCEGYATTAEEQVIITQNLQVQTQELKENAETILSAFQEQHEDAIAEMNAIKQRADETVSGRATSALGNLDLDGESVLHAQSDRLYNGVDLSVKFANEIALHNNIYEWLENRKNTGNFKGIHVGDFFYVPINAGTVNSVQINANNIRCRIVGINTYKQCGDQVVGNMFYIDSDHCFGPFMWNPEANNNGTSNNPNPFKASMAYAVLNGVNNYDATSGYNKIKHGANCANAGILQLLPAELRAVMKTKRNILDKRYSSSGLITGSTDWGWDDEPLLTLRNEVEIYGAQFKGNTCQTAGWWNPENNLSIQFPWYANNCEHRIKYVAGSNTSRCHWWLSSVASYNTSYVCHVNGSGLASSNSATYTGVYLPLCFCI